MKINYKTTFILLIAAFNLNACQDSRSLSNPTDTMGEANEAYELQDQEQGSILNKAIGCIQPSAQQRDLINLGNTKKEDFLDFCRQQTNHSLWCDQLVRPNPSSMSIFRCTYGPNQIHQLINPDENTWIHAIRSIHLIQKLSQKGIRTCQIYNWWRPEPYNKNVGGAAGRHPYGTSIDVRLCSDREAILAFDELCKLRRKGEIRAIGYYGGSSLHFGVSDRSANTWGRSCQN